MAEETQDPRNQDQAAPEATADQAAAETAQPEDGPDYAVAVEDAGTLKKKVTVTVPAEKIAAKREEMFGELSTSAQVPGFRIGHAPRRLLEKRFGKEVQRDVRNAILGDSLGKAIEKSELKVLGEPDLDLDAIELPESGDLTYGFEVEVAPEFDLPELKGIPVNKPVVEVTDARVDEAIERIRLSHARYEDTDAAAEAHDRVVVAARITGDGLEETTATATLRVAPGQIEGLPMLDLGEKLAGKKAGESVELSVKVPDVHPNESWQGKQAKVDLTINQVRKRVLPTIDDEYAKAMGYESLAEFRESMKTRMGAQVEMEIRRAMREQVDEYLVANTNFDLPEGVARRYAARLLQRRRVDLLQMGLPQAQVEERMTQIQASVAEEAKRDLKLSFILGKIADERKIDVVDEEINARVAHMAQQYGQRPERMRHQLEADGTLEQVALSIRENKVVEQLLTDAMVTEAAADPAVEDKEAPAKKTAGKAAKKSGKKASKAKPEAGEGAQENSQEESGNDSSEK
jgi:trigger factor